jgi:hypothetical protein
MTVNKVVLHKGLGRRWFSFILASTKKSNLEMKCSKEVLR